MTVRPSGPSMLKQNARERVRRITRKSFSDVASPTAPATHKAGKGVKKSSKSSVPANRTYKTSVNSIKSKPRKVTKTKLDDTRKTPFNRSSRVNYKQLKRTK